MKVVEVLWQDAVMEDDFRNPEAAVNQQPMNRRNVGYLVLDGEEKVIICYGILSEENGSVRYDDRFVIPKGMITSIKELDIPESK